MVRTELIYMGHKKGKGMTGKFHSEETKRKIRTKILNLYKTGYINPRKGKTANAWNKGLTKETDERVKRFAISLIGIKKKSTIKLKEAIRKKVEKGEWGQKGEKNGMYGKKNVWLSNYNALNKMFGICHFRGKHHTKENKEKIRQRMLKTFAENKFPQTNTKIERKMEAFLKFKNIKFYHPFNIGNYCFDFYVPENKLVIECDGDYWHNYPDGTEKDRIKDKYLKSKNLKIVRFWEREINNNFEKCAVEIEKELNPSEWFNDNN